MVCSILHVAFLSILILPWTHVVQPYTAIAQIEPLLQTQAKIIDDLDAYITKEDLRHAVLKSYLKVFKHDHENAQEDVKNYIGNPINAFKLIKRLTIDLSELQENIKLGKENIVTLNHTDVKYPSLDDLGDAALAIVRLQAEDLDVHDLAEGRVEGLKQGNPLTAADCFGFSKAMYRMRNYQDAMAWSMETLRKYNDKASQSFKEADVLKLIIFSHYYMGNVTTALEWTKQWLELDPGDAHAQRHLMFLEEAIAKIQTDLSPQEEVENTTEAYEALCRGEGEIPTTIAKRLHCRYVTETHPFLRLAPFKVEQLYIDPDISLFHDVISDSEIEVIKDKAKPKLEGAMVYHHLSGKPVVSDYRISKIAWLEDEESPAVARVTRQVVDMTGLSIMNAESLQVINYNIGGLYRPHTDFTHESQIHANKKTFGNRIATVLLYFSDVEQGGETVFTKLGLSVGPVKGSALFWLNLLPSGEGDVNTIHASCPVMRGSKWNLSLVVVSLLLHKVDEEPVTGCMLPTGVVCADRKNGRVLGRRRPEAQAAGR